MLSTWELTRDSMPRSFTGGWSHGHPLPSTHQNSRLPEGKRVFGISHIVCTNSLGPASHLISWEQRELFPNPSSQAPAKGHPCKQGFLRIASQPCCANSFLHRSYCRLLNSYSDLENHCSKDFIGVEWRTEWSSW